MNLNHLNTGANWIKCILDYIAGTESWGNEVSYVSLSLAKDIGGIGGVR